MLVLTAKQKVLQLNISILLMESINQSNLESGLRPVSIQTIEYIQLKAKQNQKFVSMTQRNTLKQNVLLICTKS